MTNEQLKSQVDGVVVTWSFVAAAAIAIILRLMITDVLGMTAHGAPSGGYEMLVTQS